jgi:hypothetical protein
MKLSGRECLPVLLFFAYRRSHSSLFWRWLGNSGFIFCYRQTLRAKFQQMINKTENIKLLKYDNA